jgi:hypothetical protein
MSHTDRGEYNCEEDTCGEKPRCFPYSLEARNNISHLQENLSDWPTLADSMRRRELRRRLAGELPIIEKHRVEFKRDQRRLTASCQLRILFHSSRLEW